MREYKPYELLEAEARQIVTAFNILDSINPTMGTLLNEEGQIEREVYESVHDLYIVSESAEQFIAKAYREYTSLLEHYNRLSPYEREHTWNNPKVFKRLRRYIAKNYPVELRLGYPEFLRNKEA